MKGNNLYVAIWVIGGLVFSFAWKHQPHQPDLNEKNGLPGNKPSRPSEGNPSYVMPHVSGADAVQQWQKLMAELRPVSDVTLLVFRVLWF